MADLITINIEQTTATSSKQFTIQVSEDSTPHELKEKLAEEQQIPISSQRLLFAGSTLNDDELLSEQSVRDNSTVFLVVLSSQQKETSTSVPLKQPQAGIIWPSETPRPPPPPHIQVQSVNIISPQEDDDIEDFDDVLEEICCLCFPLHCGVLLLMTIYVLLDLWSFFQGVVSANLLELFVGVIGFVLDAVGFHGIHYKQPSRLMIAVYWNGVKTILTVIQLIVIVGYEISRVHSSQGTERAAIGCLGALFILLYIVLQYYFLREVLYRYVRKLRGENVGRPRRVGAYEQVGAQDR